VCSSWLRRLDQGDTLFLYRRKNDSFKPPTDKGVLMVGAGTGVAPYLGFLDHLSLHTPHLPTLLVTGNRFKARDSIYAEEFTAHQAAGVLKSYRTAYSRDQGSTCKYVQDVLERDARDIVAFLDEGAAVYVCGDAKGLGAGVFEMLRTILEKEKGLGREEAEGILMEMKKKKLYCEDIWS